MNLVNHKDTVILSEESLKRLHSMILNFLQLTNGQLSNHIDLCQYSIDSGNPITNVLIQELCVLQPNIITLNLSHSHHITDISLWSIAKHCNPNTLKEINFTDCHRITNIGLRSLALKCYSIEILTFTNCSLIDDYSLIVIASGNWKLKQLYLRNCRQITDTGISKVVKVNGRLEVLDLYGCSGIGEFCDNGLKEIGIYCHQLKHLDLSFCRRINYDGLKSIAIGCNQLKQLYFHSNDNINGKGLSIICKYLSSSLESLSLIHCKHLNDSDYGLFKQTKFKLKELNLTNNSRITDHGIQSIVIAYHATLIKLNLTNLKLITNHSIELISKHCSNLIDLNLSKCVLLTNQSIENLSNNSYNQLRQLNLTDDHLITMQTLINYLPKFPYMKLSSKWFGYESKDHSMNDEDIIHKNQILKDQLYAIVRIQSIFRMKRCYVRYHQMRRYQLVNKQIPIIQSMIRRYLQIKRYKKILNRKKQIQCAVVIQSWFRKCLQMRIHSKYITIVDNIVYNETMCIKIQSFYRQCLAKRYVQSIRYQIANQHLIQAKLRILQEKSVILIQRIYRGYHIRNQIAILIQQKHQYNQYQYYLQHSVIIIQTWIRKHICQKKLILLKQQKEYEYYQWTKARVIQRYYRGYLGRLKYYKQIQSNQLKSIIESCIIIQKYYRRYNQRLQYMNLINLKKYQIKKIYSVVVIQKLIRGYLSRKYTAKLILLTKQYELEAKSALLIQRIYRGYKGRELIIIERELTKYEGNTKPLHNQLKQYELNYNELVKQYDIIKTSLNHMKEDLDKIELELEYVMKSNNKYCDSTILTNYPQRYLTKYLRIRLNESYENKKDEYKNQQEILEKKTIEMKALETNIRQIKRELVALTTGKIVSLKTNRMNTIRSVIRKRKQAAIRIQSQWRKTAVRIGKLDPGRDYWIECFDEDQSEYPFFYNTLTQQTSWIQPLAYKYFSNPSIGRKIDYNKRIDEDMSSLGS